VQWFWSLLWSLVVVFVVLESPAYTVLLERQGLLALQGRIGPNRVRVPFFSDIPLIGPFLTKLGFFQMWADIGKLC
jgi:NADH:ubiquinone oxidoreductase subunit H